MRRATITRRVALATLAATTLGAAALPHAGRTQTPPWRDLRITAQPVARFSKTSAQTVFGQLTFLGGLDLSAEDRDFGGLSGLAIEADGRSFVAVTDEGSWLTATLVTEGSTPTALSSARMGPILAASGQPHTRKRDKDCEAIALLDGTLVQGTVLVAFERTHRIEQFPVRGRIIQPSAGVLTLPPDAARMEGNKGIEAMTALKGGQHDGSIIAFSERMLDADGHHTGWLWINGVPQRLGLTALGGFDITDVAALPDGALIVLERRFRWAEGVRMQIRLIPAAEIAPGRVATGRVLLTADNTFEIDNMEAIAAHQEPNGTTVLTLLSDNNYNRFLQRTLLLRFALSA
jgi:hypothetical protein